jgi:hypothetical protein
MRNVNKPMSEWELIETLRAQEEMHDRLTSPTAREWELRGRVFGDTDVALILADYREELLGEFEKLAERWEVFGRDLDDRTLLSAVHADDVRALIAKLREGKP